MLYAVRTTTSQFRSRELSIVFVMRSETIQICPQSRKSKKMALSIAHRILPGHMSPRILAVSRDQTSMSCVSARLALRHSWSKTMTLPISVTRTRKCHCLTIQVLTWLVELSYRAQPLETSCWRQEKLIRHWIWSTRETWSFEAST